MKCALDIAWAVIPWTLLLVLLLNLGGAMQAFELRDIRGGLEFAAGMAIAGVTLGLYAFAERGR